MAQPPSLIIHSCDASVQPCMHHSVPHALPLAALLRLILLPEHRHLRQMCHTHHATTTTTATGRRHMIGHHVPAPAIDHPPTRHKPGRVGWDGDRPAEGRRQEAARGDDAVDGGRRRWPRWEASEGPEAHLGVGWAGGGPDLGEWLQVGEGPAVLLVVGALQGNADEVMTLYESPLLEFVEYFEPLDAGDLGTVQVQVVHVIHVGRLTPSEPQTHIPLPLRVECWVLVDAEQRTPPGLEISDHRAAKCIVRQDLLVDDEGAGSLRYRIRRPTDDRI
mmetsp:Transcript_12794/g.37168  ORF Transcript_12794/g.37168 Transcript_12794/m.37168 type:complete len:276 (+) Transcript_12794:33-860(+)